MRPRRLRTRVTALFAGGAFVLSVGLAVGSYEITRHNLLAERERTAIRAAYFDAAVVRPGVVGDDADIVAALGALDTGQGRRPLVRKDGRWYARNADDGLTRAVPTAMLELVGHGTPAVQRVQLLGKPAVVVGVPFRADTAFFEVQSLAEAEATLRTLSGTLAALALGATAAAAALSLWVARRALSPLRAVADTAGQVSRGDLSTRMPSGDDPDLEVLTRSFNGMVTEVAQRMERERRFAADVSHELRSPLQTLASASQVLLNRQDELDARGRTAAVLVAQEVERFNALVQALLDLARADRPAQLDEVDVAAVVQRVAERHGVPAGHVTTPGAPLLWQVDPPRLEQVLDNLLSNACKHGGGVAALSVTTVQDRLVIDVDDTGPGIPSDEREIVFDRFGRGRAAHVRDGADGVGLGLSLVAEHVAAHSGQVSILDRPGGGCRVRIELPGQT
jgi:signal transduction histidine kinase